MQMPRNGSGLFNLPSQSPAISGTLITAADRNAIDNDIATALTQSLSADGQTTVTANLPLNSHKLTGLIAGTEATDSVNLGQVQSAASTLLGSVSGTDTITATLSPTLTAYASGQMFKLIPANNNTGAVTLNINSLGAKAITKNGATALAADDLVAGVVYIVEYDGTQFQAIGAGLQAQITALDTEKADLAGATFTGDVEVPDEAYGSGWNASVEVPTKNAVYDKIESMNITSGKIAQIVSTGTGTVATGTTLLPYDNTIPQITEGTEFMTQAITPQNASSTLEIDVTIVLSNTSTNSQTGAALFQDSTANALAAADQFVASASGSVVLTFKHVMTAGTTSETTFKVRGGSNVAGTTTFNGQGGVQGYGGVMASRITIKEILP